MTNIRATLASQAIRRQLDGNKPAELHCFVFLFFAAAGAAAGTVHAMRSRAGKRSS